MPGSKIKIAIKYCGSCNPYIDLSKISHRLKEAIEEDAKLVMAQPLEGKADVIVILCGCPRACGNKEEIRALGQRSIVVSGEAVDQAPVAENEISAIILKKLKTPTD